MTKLAKSTERGSAQCEHAKRWDDVAGEISKSHFAALPVYSMLRLDSKSAAATEDLADNEALGFARLSRVCGLCDISIKTQFITV